MDSAVRKKILHRLRMVSCLLALALIAAACGSGDAGPQAGGADDEPPADAGTAPAGNGGTEGEPAAGGEQIELRFSWWGSDVRHEITQEVIDRFEQEHPNITITGEFTGWAEYWDRLATTVAGGDAPDIIQHEIRYLREYAERGALLDLSQYVPDVLRTENLDQEVLPTGEIDGALYGLPSGVNAYTIVADPQVFEEAGVELPDDSSWSWDDFMTVAEDITAGTPEGIYGTQDPGYNEAGLQIYARQRGSALYTQDGGLAVSPEMAAEWWQLIVDLRDRGATPPPSMTSEVQAGGIEQSLLSTNSGAMAFFWTNEFPTLEELSGRDLVMLRFPGESTSEQPGMYFKPSMYYSVSSDTEHPEAAAMFLDFLVNEMAAVEVLLTDRGLPTNVELRQEVAGSLSATDQEVVDYLDALEGNLAEPPPVPPLGAGDVADITFRINEQVIFDQITPEQAGQQFVSEAEAALGG